MKKPIMGRGKKMSIAKAALIYYYRYYLANFGGPGLNYGQLDIMGDIVSIAGAKQCSFFTPAMVSSCLSKSPFWDKMLVKGFYAGYGNGSANIYTPSPKGKFYYYKNLKSIEVDEQQISSL